MYLVWVPIAIAALALLAWAVLAGLPFRREPRQPERRPINVISERDVTTGTVPQIGQVESLPAPPLQPPPLALPPEPARPPNEISESEAQRALHGSIVARTAIPANCVSVSSLGYKNAGYTFDVSDRCAGTPLGRWRVDSEDPSGVFLQQPDGRYLPPS